jgi:hypothetical protein
MWTSEAVAKHLPATEKLLWTGRPVLSVWFPPDDWFCLAFGMFLSAIAAGWTLLMARTAYALAAFPATS